MRLIIKGPPSQGASTIFPLKHSDGWKMGAPDCLSRCISYKKMREYSRPAMWSLSPEGKWCFGGPFLLWDSRAASEKFSRGSKNHMCDRVDQLPIFPYNRGWEKSTQVRRGLYTHYKDSLLKVGWVYPQYKEFRPWLTSQTPNPPNLPFLRSTQFGTGIYIYITYMNGTYESKYWWNQGLAAWFRAKSVIYFSW